MSLKEHPAGILAFPGIIIIMGYVLVNKALKKE